MSDQNSDEYVELTDQAPNDKDGAEEQSEEDSMSSFHVQDHHVHIRGKKQEEIGETYDEAKWPIDFKTAELFYKATRFGKEFKKDEDTTRAVDPCSLKKLNNHKFGLCETIENFAPLGAGYPLYFHFLRFVILMFSIICLIQALPNLLYNKNGTTCGDTTLCRNSYILELSFANRLEEYAPGDVWAWMDLTVIVFLILAFIYWRQKMLWLLIEYDENLLSVSDYTVVINNLPKDFGPYNIEQTIREWIAMDQYGYEVTDVSLAYNLNEYTQNEKKIGRLSARISFFSKFFPKKNNAELQAKIDSINNRQKEILADFATGTSKQFLGVAYVSFQTQQMCQDFLESYGVEGELRKFRIKRGLATTLNGEFDVGKPEVEVTHIFAEQADEPEDVIWKNLAVTEIQFVRRRFLANFLNVAGLVLSCYLLYRFQKYSDTLVEEESGVDLESDTTSYLTIRGLLFAVSFLVVSIGNGLSAMIDWSSTFSGYECLSKQDGAIASSTTLVVFFNTTVLSFIATSLNGNDFFSEAGLLVTSYGILSTTGYLNPFYAIFNKKWFIWRIKQWWVRRKKPEDIKKNQQELIDEYFTLPVFPMPSLVADKLVYVMTGAIFSGIIPMGSIWCLVGLILAYPVEKWILIRRSSNLRHYSGAIIQEMTEVLEWVLVVYSIGMVVKEAMANASGIVDNKIGYPPPITIALVVSVLHCLLPMHLINSKLFKLRQEKATDEPFEHAKDECNKDYIMTNPAYGVSQREYLINIKKRCQNKLHAAKQP